MTGKKSLRYAYESSPNAEMLNDGKGCWLVDDGSNSPPLVFQDHEKDSALDMFESINREVDLVYSMVRGKPPFDGPKYYRAVAGVYQQPKIEEK